MDISQGNQSGMAIDHACCGSGQEMRGEHKQSRLNNVKSLVVGPLAAFLACLCCSLPLLPLMFGLSAGLTFKNELGRYHGVFEAAAVVILLGACFHMWRQHKKSGKPLQSFVLHAATTLALYGLMSFVMNQFVVPAVTGASMHSHSGLHRLTEGKDSRGN